ncbi:hypothetical protein Pint_10669 [Pistacia integerrima]|uniref:Uncharacterized protein n=1 Tax=Pistacia integerrima TaxID=434235 RepID=A0ACC0XNA2_9ROSI|nr:hypothetical protein Pint_10669 [Pistacia integerrima]
MATQMDEKLNKYWSVIHGVMRIAMVLDPRFKLKLLDFFFPYIYGDDGPHEIRRIRRLCNYLYVQYESNHRNYQTQQSFIASSNTSSQAKFQRMRILASLDKFLEEESGLAKKILSWNVT